MGLAIRASLIAFFALLKRWKLVLFFFLFNFLFSVFLAAPLFVAISEDAGHFGGLDRFVHRFDPVLLADFTGQNGDFLRNFFLTVGLGGLIYYFLYHILSGGMLSILADVREKTSMKTFLRGCGRYAFRYARLFFYFCVFLVALAFINHWLNQALAWYFNDFLEYGASSAALGWIMMAKNILMLILLFYAIVSLNYAKTAVVTRDRHFMGSTFLKGMSFSLSHPLVTGFYFVLSLVLLGAVILGYRFTALRIDPYHAYSFLENMGPLTISGALLYLLLAQLTQLLIQACLVFRHAGQVYIFRYLTVQDSNPDPELAASDDPFSPFIPDRPYTGPDDDAYQPELKEGKSNA